MKNDKAEIVAVCRSSKDKLQMVKDMFGVEGAYTDWRDMLEKSDLDAVVVGTPHDLHTEPVVTALEKSLHVLVEKPLTIRSEDARKILAVAETSGKVVMAAYNNLFEGNWRTAKEAIEGESIGVVHQVCGAFSRYRHYFWEEKKVPEKTVRAFIEKYEMPEGLFDGNLSEDWRSSFERNGGGTFSNAGNHDVNLALWLAGSAPAEVSAFTAPDRQEPEYFISVLARLEDEVQFSFTFADAVPKGMVQKLTIIGDQGFLSYDKTDGGIKITANGETETLLSEYDDISPMDAFVSSIIDGRPNLSPAESAANTVYLTEAAYRSAKEGRTILI